MIPNLMAHLVDSARDLRMAFHILSALEKSGGNPFGSKVIDQMQTSFTRAVVKGQCDRSSVAIAAIDRGSKELRGSGGNAMNRSCGHCGASGSGENGGG